LPDVLPPDLILGLALGLASILAGHPDFTADVLML
jgi:hypothetical protein